jgi:hypothetical protein
MTDLERLSADRDVAIAAALDAARVAYSAARRNLQFAGDAYKDARLAYSTARDASKACNAILAAQDKEDKNV